MKKLEDTHAENLSFVEKILECACRLGQWHFGIGGMQVMQVNTIRSQSLERFFALSFDRFRASIFDLYFVSPVNPPLWRR